VKTAFIKLGIEIAIILLVKTAFIKLGCTQH